MLQFNLHIYSVVSQEAAPGVLEERMLHTKGWGDQRLVVWGKELPWAWGPAGLLGFLIESSRSLPPLSERLHSSLMSSGINYTPFTLHIRFSRC